MHRCILSQHFQTPRSWLKRTSFGAKVSNVQMQSADASVSNVNAHKRKKERRRDGETENCPCPLGIKHFIFKVLLIRSEDFVTHLTQQV